MHSDVGVQRVKFRKKMCRNSYRTKKIVPINQCGGCKVLFNAWFTLRLRDAILYVTNVNFLKTK